LYFVLQVGYIDHIYGLDEVMTRKFRMDGKSHVKKLRWKVDENLFVGVMGVDFN